MPLRYKCVRCAQELLLEEAFCGAGCRCQYCRAYMRVPPRAAVARAPRPAQPPLTAAIPVAATRPRPIPAANPAPTAARRLITFRGRFAIAAGIVLAVSVTSTTAWMLDRHKPVAPNNQLVAVHNEPAPVVAEPAKTTRPKTRGPDVQKSFFGVPVKGEIVAYVVDGDAAMAPYMDQVSFAANFVNQSVQGSRRFGIVKPDQPRGPSLMGVTQTEGSLANSEAVLSPRLPEQPVDLAKNVALAAAWPADQILMVVAKPLSPEEIDALADAAEKSGAKTSVIAVGPAAKLDLSKISEATEGRFVALSDARLADWAAKYQAAGR